MLWKFATIYNPERQYTDHFQVVKYAMQPPERRLSSAPTSSELYVHMPQAARREAAHV